MIGKNKIKVGFIGIGNMGWPMAMNLFKAGYDLTVFDLDKAGQKVLAWSVVHVLQQAWPNLG